MTSPGWYPDPHDPAWQQFHDGRQWTGDRRPAGAATDPVAATTSYAAQHTTEQLPAEPYPPLQQIPPEQAGAGAYPAYDPQPEYPNAAAPAHRRSRLKLPLIVGTVVVVVAGLLTGGYFLFLRGGSPKFTYNGKRIADPDQPLARAASTVARLVQSRHGAQGSKLLCYYAVPEDPAKGTKKSDVDQTIWCGPVVFVDGDPSKEYLGFTVTSAAADGGKVSLTPADKPVDAAPSAKPAGFTLKRPDGATPPAGSGGVAVPQPPRAAKDVLTVVSDLGTQKVPAAPADAVIGSVNGGIRLTAVGPVTRYGSGDDARTAPDGEKLIAFQLAAGYDADGDQKDLRRAVTVSVDGGKGRQLPSGHGDHYVIAVPVGAKSVDLVLNDAGHKQTLSLLTGKPGTGNLVVLARSHRVVSVNKKFSVQLKLSQDVVFPDGKTGSSETVSVVVQDAYLWWNPPNHPAAKPSKPGNALLYVNIGFHDPHQPSATPFGFRPELLHFTPTGGKAIAARNVATSADKLYDVFEVPAGLTTGTLTISGQYTDKFDNSDDTYTTKVVSAVKVPVKFPAG